MTRFRPYSSTLWLLVASLAIPSIAFAGSNKIFVPMSWCIVQGTPAANSPPNNIGADNETDAIIWRRHERPTDTIFTPLANMSLRSSINNAWTVLDFPIINDPNPAGGMVLGDIRGEDVNVNGAEFFAIMNACDAVYASPQYGRAGIGITAVNVNLFHDGAGNYVNTIGWGGCTEAPPGTCVVPYNGLIGVIDNRYLHPDSPNRMRPDGGTYATTDPRDVLTGHEVGHALSLDHVNNTSRMMNPFITGNNFALSGAEIAALRANALNVPGVQVDPPGVFNPGAWQATRIPDPLGDDRGEGFLDIASANVAFNKETGEFHAEILGRDKLPIGLPEPPCEWVMLLDMDDDPGTGLRPDTLKALGVPAGREGFEGADIALYATVDVAGAREQTVLTHRAIALVDGQVADVSDLVRAEVRDLTVYRVLAERPTETLPERAVISQSIAWVANPKLRGFDKLPGFPFDPANPKPMDVPIQAFISVNREEQDVLDPDNRGRRLVLEDPNFPECFPPDVALAGETIEVGVEKMPPGAELHALLGDELVVELVKADDNGEATVAIPIPKDTAGERLITVGVIDAALTADCTVTVKGECDRADIDGDGVVTRRDIAILGLDFRNQACR